MTLVSTPVTGEKIADLKEELMASANDLYDRAVILSKQFDENFMELGRTLKSLRDKDPEKYRLVIMSAGLGRRKAYYLVNIAEKFHGLGIPKHKLLGIGWTKLVAISEKITKTNADELIELAENNTVKDLKAILKGGEAMPNSRCVMLYFSPKDYDDFAKALVANGGKVSGRGLLDKEQALLNLIKKAVPTG